MRYLSSSYWVNFKKDGKLFEQLSKTLIEYEYNQTDFYLVGGPGDNGIDISKDISLLNGYKNQIWAQCKYYHKTLSFDDISYTLLMAYLKNTNQILIFSYSKVSKALENNLDEYRTRTAKDVILYSDDDLETLILKHHKRILNEHPEYFPSFPNIQTRSIESFKVDYQMYIDGQRITENEITININTICELVISITNRNSVSQEFKLNCVKNRKSNAYVFLKQIPNNRYVLKSNHTMVFKEYVKLNNSSGKNELPEYELSYDGKIKRIVSTKILNFRWLADTSLIGKNYYSSLKKINDSISSPHFHLVYVYGNSGVGKSRILKEAQTQCVKLNKKIITIDTEKKEFSCKKFIELLCSKMTLLPIFDKDIKVISNSSEISLEYATKILYDNSFDIVNEWKNIVKFFGMLMSEKSYVLILDNIQHFDKISIKILDNLIHLLNTLEKFQVRG